MAEASATSKRQSWTRTGLGVIAPAFCVGLVIGMGLIVLREIDELSTANSDNRQWSLAQADVEFLQFQLALARAQENPAGIDELRKRFDIFYSRRTTLERGAVFQRLRADPDFARLNAVVDDFVTRTVPLIDGPDETLIAALPALAAEAEATHDAVRLISLQGLGAFAELSDSRREELLRALVRIGIVLGVLFAGLVMLALTLFRFAKLAAARTREIEETSARMGLIVDTSLDPIVVTDGDGIIRDFNLAAERVFGYRAAQAIGRSAIDLLYPPEMHEELRAERLSFVDQDRRPKRGERRMELVAMNSAGRRFPVELLVDRAELHGEPIYVAFIHDISRRKAAEEGLTEARDKALAGEKAKAEFLAVMSHEMRTPLNGMLGTMQLMRDHSLTERQADLLDRMQNSGQLLLGLVNDVLDLSKLEAGKMETENRPFGITRLLDGVIETTAALAAQTGNTLSWRWEGEAAEGAMGDPRALRQVILNLVGNALKFTRGGTVEIEVELLGRARDQLEVRVIDTGIGIDEGDLQRIFHDFETLDSSYARKAGGTGLGLGISRRLARIMGGELGAESEPGEGSLFWVRVPTEALDTAPEPARKGSGDPAALPASRALNLLLVEDNEINRFVAREMLEADGHRVTEAVNGRAGVEWAEAEAFDAILMDISMPVMDGTEATRTIRSGTGKSARAPIIAVTAHALPEEVERFHAVGMDACISKPIDRMELLTILRELGVEEPDAAAEAPAPEAAPAQPLFDPAHLSDLGTRVSREALDGLVDRFTTGTAADIEALAAMDPDHPDLAALAHKCAGGCGTFGLAALRAELAWIETCRKLGEPIDPARITGLAPLWERSRTALEDWRRLRAA